MNPQDGTTTAMRRKAIMAAAALLLISVGAVVLASVVQRDFGRLEVRDVYYPNDNGIMIRAKLFRPQTTAESNLLPGVVYIHGFQNNRETGDAYCIETARRGFVVLNIDAIGRGHSGIPGDLHKPDFDHTYGGKSSIAYLRALPFVNAKSVGIMGHSLGAEMAYKVALHDDGIKALVITGFAYTLDASHTAPKNMLMIMGQYDEFRQRMTGTRDIVKEWMNTERTKKVFPVDSPQMGKTYGNFNDGTARRVYVPNITHIHESHHAASITETVTWFRSALHPPDELWIDPGKQIWHIKEWMTLLAMLSALAMLLPLGTVLINVPFFRNLKSDGSSRYGCSSRAFLKYSAVNGLLLWLYLPLILVLFGIHKYLVRIDGVFPMMMVNAKVWWFLWVNIIGLFLIKRWYRKNKTMGIVSIADLGISYDRDSFFIDKNAMIKTLMTGMLLFLFVYLLEFLSEKIFIINYRFLIPFMSDLTCYRAGMFLLYWPFIFFCFVVNGVFLHGQIRRPGKHGFSRTFVSWSISNVGALVIPLLLFLMIQYVPLFTTGYIPFVGPNGLFVAFIINLFHIVVLLTITAVISTWYYMLTGKVYLGAFLNSLLITWIFASSQVIAPIPV